MPELTEVETPKNAGFVQNKSTLTANRKRIEQDEAELKALMEGRTESPTEEESTEKKEANTEVKEETLSAEEKSFKKRYGDLRRHMQEKEKEWDEKFQAFEARLKKEAIVPPKSDEDIEEWSKEYPDVAGIVETIAAKIAQKKFDEANQELKDLKKVQSEAQRAKAENAIRKSHDDFDDLRASDEFHSWVDEQPKWVQDALYENSDDPASVVRVIDLYKVDKGLTKTAKKAKAKDAASTVTKRSKTEIDVEDANDVIRESEVAKMSDKEFEANSDDINKAIRSGKFVYDVSGKAR